MENSKAVIRSICGNIAERIRACRSRHVAEMLKERLCSELASQCKSEIVHNFLQHHVDELINETFDVSGNNLTLKEKNDVSKN